DAGRGGGVLRVPAALGSTPTPLPLELHALLPAFRAAWPDGPVRHRGHVVERGGREHHADAGATPRRDADQALALRAPGIPRPVRPRDGPGGTERGARRTRSPARSRAGDRPGAL